MKIAQIAPIVESVPPEKYGGTELVVSNITEELVQRGHEVHLFAAAESKTKAILHPYDSRSIRTNISCSSDYPQVRDAHMYMYTAEMMQELMYENFDIIHNHLGWRLLPFASLLRKNMVTTLHGVLSFPGMLEYLKRYYYLPFVSISNSQRLPIPHLNYTTIYHGIKTKEFEFNAKAQDYVAFLGRITPLKGIKEAILAAKMAHTRIVIGAKIDPVDQEYYEQEIKPLIDGKMVQYIGEVDHPNKVKLIKNAKALMALINWEEPFGLFLVESLACGTPVIAYPRGSVTEIITDGQTGRLVKTIEEAAEAIRTIDSIDRNYCRNYAVQKFDISRMVDNYEKLFYKLSLLQPFKKSFETVPTKLQTKQEVERLRSNRTS